MEQTTQHLLDEVRAIRVAFEDGLAGLIVFRSVIPYRDYGIVKDKAAAWDGPAQIKAADAATLRKICAWYDAEKPDLKSSYKLPHHHASDLKAVWRGVTAAMSRLMQAATQIPDSERRRVYNHLARHYTQFGEDPPPFK